MWTFIAKILAKIGTKVGAKAAAKVLEKGGEQVVRKGVQKILEKGAQNIAEKGLEKGIGKIASTVSTASKYAKNVSALASKVGGQGGGKNAPLITKLMNIATGRLGRNLPNYGDTTGMLGKYKGWRGDQLMGLASGNIDKVWDAEKAFTSNLTLTDAASQYAKNSADFTSRIGGQNASSITPERTGFFGNDIVEDEPKQRGGGKVLGFLNKAFNQESLGSKFLLNTISNLGRSGAFSRNDDLRSGSNFGGALANSAAASLGQSVEQQRQDTYDNQNRLMHMIEDADFSEEMVNSYSPKALEKINGFQSSLVGKLAKNRTMGVNRLTSEDLLQARQEYTSIKKELMNFNNDLSLYRTAESEMRSKPDVYSIQDFDTAKKSWSNTGRAPVAIDPGQTNPFLRYRPQDPKAVFTQKPATSKSLWSGGTPENGFMQTGPLTEQEKMLKAVEWGISDPGVRRWAQENGYNMTDQRDQIRFGVEHGQYIDRPVPDNDERRHTEKIAADKAERYAKNAEQDRAKKGWDVTDNFLGQGKAVVFSKNKVQNIEKSVLEEATGKKLSAFGTSIPVTFEYIGEDGSLRISVKGFEGEDAYNIPLSKASGLVESFYPGASQAAASIKTKSKGVLREDQSKWGAYIGGF